MKVLTTNKEPNTCIELFNVGKEVNKGSEEDWYQNHPRHDHDHKVQYIGTHVLN